MKYTCHFFYTSILIATVLLCLNLFSFEKYDLKIIGINKPAFVVQDSDNKIKKLPFSIYLNKPIYERYSSGKEKHLSAYVSIKYKDNVEKISISVNQPYFYHQYGLYLFDIGKTTNNEDYVILRITISRYRNAVFLGLLFVILTSLFLMLSSSLSLLKTEKKWVFLGLLSVVTISVVMIIYKMNPMLQNSEIPPILRSVWFLPHVLLFVISYAILICAWISSGIKLFNKKQNISTDKIFTIGLTFYTTGLIFGIIWAHFAWGTFWGWDIKETLSLITFGYGISVLPLLKNEKVKNNVLFTFFLITVFMVLLLTCWVGPTLFKLGGMHSY